MITFYKNMDSGLELIQDITPGCWINVVDPTPGEIDRLTALGIPQDFVTYALDIDERSRIEREDDGKLLVLLRTPIYLGTTVDIPYNTVPMGIILMEQNVVTVSRKENNVLLEMTSGKVRGMTTAKKNRFLLRILLSTATKYLNMLREINTATELVEDKLTASLQNKEVMELLKYQKSLVYFTTALKSNELMLRRLQTTQIFKQFPDDEDLLEDVITETQQAIEMVNISGSILAGMMDAFASIISNNLNVVMKFLASVTILLSIPTIVTGFYGMNVAIPFMDQPWAFALIIGISLLAVGIVLVIFIRRKWF